MGGLGSNREEKWGNGELFREGEEGKNRRMWEEDKVTVLCLKIQYAENTISSTWLSKGSCMVQFWLVASRVVWLIQPWVSFLTLQERTPLSESIHFCWDSNGEQQSGQSLSMAL